MSVQVRFHCDGCTKVAEGTERIRSDFVSVSGRSYGVGSFREEPASTKAPEGWVPFDPFTRCCYCPECWQQIAEATGEWAADAGPSE